MALSLTKPAEGTVAWAAAINENFTKLQSSLNLTEIVQPGESIQDAIDRTVTAGGGTVQLAAGTHTPSSTVNLNGAKVRLVGVGSATKIASTASPALSVTGSDCSIENLYIDASASARHGIALSGSYQSVHRCKILGSGNLNGKYGIDAGGGGTHLRITECRIESFQYAYFGESNSVTTSEYVWFSKNEIIDVNVGFQARRIGTSVTTYNCFIQNNWISFVTSNSNPGHGVLIGCTTATEQNGMHVEGNSITASGSGTSGGCIDVVSTSAGLNAGFIIASNYLWGGSVCGNIRTNYGYSITITGNILGQAASGTFSITTQNSNWNQHTVVCNNSRRDNSTLVAYSFDANTNAANNW